MQMFDLETARGSLGRGLARQAFAHAERDDADVARALRDLHGLAPNRRNRVRMARRLARRPGVVSAVAGPCGVTVVMRTALEVTVQQDGSVAYAEPRIAWVRVHAVARDGVIGFDTLCLQASLHALQRRVERSDIALCDLLGRLDLSMARALRWLARGAPLRDRDDAYLPASDGVWAGRVESMAQDPAWGPAFRADGAIPVYSVRTFLGEDQMRPTVWLQWSEARRRPTG